MAGKKADRHALVLALLDQTLTEYDHDNPAGALMIANRLLEIEPGNLQGNCLKAQCYMSAHHFSAAVRIADAVLKTHPQEKRMVALRKEGLDYEKLYGSCKCPLESWKQSDLRELYHAKDLAQRGQVQKAISLLSDRIKRVPNDEMAYFARSGMMERRGDYRAALADVNKILAINPADKQAYIERARLERTLKEPAKAAQDFSTALKFDPHSPYFARHALEELYSERGQCYMAAHQYENASKDFEQLLKEGPDDAVYQRYLGDCRLACRDLKGALAAYTKAIESEPDAGSTYYARARVYDLMSRKDLAESDRKKAKALGFTPAKPGG